MVCANKRLAQVARHLASLGNPRSTRSIPHGTSSLYAAALVEQAVRSGLTEGSNSNLNTRWRRMYRRGTWDTGEEARYSSLWALTGTFAATALLLGLGTSVTGSPVLQEQGPVPGGPILGEEDEEDSFHRFSSGSPVHHAIKV